MPKLARVQRRTGGVELVLTVGFWESARMEKARSLGMERNPASGTWHTLHPTWEHFEAFQSLMDVQVTKALRQHLRAQDQAGKDRVRRERALKDAGCAAPFGVKDDGSPRKRKGTGGRPALTPQERMERRRRSKEAWRKKNLEKAAAYVRKSRAERGAAAGSPMPGGGDSSGTLTAGAGDNSL